MRRPRHEIEAGVPLDRIKRRPGQVAPGSRPQIRRQVERICESLEINFDDLLELHISRGRAIAVMYDRDEEGRLYRDVTEKVATTNKAFEVDTTTFLGDERDF